MIGDIEHFVLTRTEAAAPATPRHRFFLNILSTAMALVILAMTASFTAAEAKKPFAVSPDKTNVIIHDIISKRWRWHEEGGGVLRVWIRYRDNDLSNRNWGRNTDSTSIGFPQVYRNGRKLYAKGNGGTFFVGTVSGSLVSLSGARLVLVDTEYYVQGILEKR